MSKYTEDNKDTRKGFRGQFERAPTGQIWDILNIKINIDSIDYNILQK